MENFNNLESRFIPLDTAATSSKLLVHVLIHVQKLKIEAHLKKQPPYHFDLLISHAPSAKAIPLTAKNTLKEH